MDYKTIEHSNNFKCPECDNIEYVNKEYGKDDYSNYIFMFECKCGHKYWFHKGGKKIGNTLMGLKHYYDIARNVICSKRIRLKERYEKTYKALKAYFYCDFRNNDEMQLGIGLITELEYRIAYDSKLLMALYSPENIGHETIQNCMEVNQ